MSDADTTVATLREAVRQFADERAWQPFHSPKNLSMCLAAEAAELMEHFLWVDSEESRSVVRNPAKLRQVADEVADVACLVFNLCNTLDIDLSDTVRDKMARNAVKYPADQYRGRHTLDG